MQNDAQILMIFQVVKIRLFISGCLLIPCILFGQVDTTQNNSSDTVVYTFLDVEPEYPGGYKAMMAFIQSNFRYPQSAIENNITGVAMARFVVKSDGFVDSVSIEQGIPGCPECNEEVLRVVKLMPRWKPGKVEGKDVSSVFRLPITFELDGGKGLPSKPLQDLVIANIYWKPDQYLFDALLGEESRIYPFYKKSSKFYQIYYLAGNKFRVRKGLFSDKELEGLRTFKFATKKNAKQFRKFYLYEFLSLLYEK